MRTLATTAIVLSLALGGVAMTSSPARAGGWTLSSHKCHVGKKWMRYWFKIGGRCKVATHGRKVRKS